jgi:hypothetical protein
VHEVGHILHVTHSSEGTGGTTSEDYGDTTCQMGTSIGAIYYV